MASDQGLYAYAGVRLLAGDAPYAGAWDQKPPGIHVVYALLWALWPNEAVVAAADMAAAGVIAWLLVVLGRRRFTEATGMVGALVFLALGNPALTQRLGGVFVRAQCETFIALAVTAALVLAAVPVRRTRHLVGIGLLLASAFWLKYNAAAYALVIATALACWDSAPRTTWLRSVLTVGAAGLAGVVLPLIGLGVAGALTDLYLATIAYNARYSGETYDGLRGLLAYAAHFPIERARNDVLWFMGGLGTVSLVVALARSRDPRHVRSALVVLAWLAAAGISILINGARHLPQYFVQAAPALALAAGVGLVPVWMVLRRRHLGLAIAALVLVLVAAERVTSLGDLVARTGADWRALTGETPRSEYLSYFGGRPQDKYVASAIAELVQLITVSTTPDDTIYVFGFSPGVPVLAKRVSASRFHWSQPIVTDFEVGRPGYGAAGLRDDLERSAPALVALQRDNWAGDRHSADYFHAAPDLEAWLRAHYVREGDVSRFEIWRRR